MNAAHDCFVKLNLAIRCEEQDALVVFQLSKEDCHKAIMDAMVRGSLLYECICLV